MAMTSPLAMLLVKVKVAVSTPLEVVTENVGV
jgi:hypothetical protein